MSRRLPQSQQPGLSGFGVKPPPPPAPPAPPGATLSARDFAMEMAEELDKRFRFGLAARVRDEAQAHDPSTLAARIVRWLTA